MSLIRDLQQNRLPGPTSRKFNLDDWIALGEISSIDADEREVLAIGLFIHGALASMRDRLKFVSTPSIPVPYKRILLLGTANREALVTEMKAKRELIGHAGAGRTITFSDMAGYKLKLPAGDFTPEEISDTALEATAALLRMLPTSHVITSPSDETSLVEMITDINLAIAYKNVEDLWQDVIWHGYRRNADDPSLYVTCHEQTLICRAAEFYRARMTAAHRRQIAEVAANARRRLDGEAKLDRVNVVANSIEIGWAVSIPDYYRKKIDELSPIDKELTLAHILGAVDVLTMIAYVRSEAGTAILEKEFYGGSDGVNPACLVCHIEVTELTKNLVDTLGISPDVAVRILTFLTFGAEGFGRPTYDLWIAPCVRLDNDYLGLASHALRNGSRTFQVNGWLRKLGFDLDFKGTQFEVFARKSLADSISGSLLETITWIFPESFSFTPDGGQPEEIDLLIVVGCHVVVGELKCFLQPVEGIDWANHEKKLHAAALQAARKAKAVHASKAAFEARASQLGLRLPPTYEVTPLVILDSAVGAGRELYDVPIVDLKIMEIFFDGSMVTKATLGPTGLLNDHEYLKIYDSIEGALDSFRIYLKSPPQLALVKDSVVVRDIATNDPGRESPLFVQRKYDVLIA